MDNFTFSSIKSDDFRVHDMKKFADAELYRVPTTLGGYHGFFKLVPASQWHLYNFTLYCQRTSTNAQRQQVNNAYSSALQKMRTAQQIPEGVKKFATWLMDNFKSNHPDIVGLWQSYVTEERTTIKMKFLDAQDTLNKKRHTTYMASAARKERRIMTVRDVKELENEVTAEGSSSVKLGDYVERSSPGGSKNFEEQEDEQGEEAQEEVETNEEPRVNVSHITPPSTARDDSILPQNDVSSNWILSTGTDVHAVFNDHRSRFSSKDVTVDLCTSNILDLTSAILRHQFTDADWIEMSRVDPLPNAVSEEVRGVLAKLMIQDPRTMKWQFFDDLPRSSEELIYTRRIFEHMYFLFRRPRNELEDTTLTEGSFIVKILGPILDLLFADVNDVIRMQWGESTSETSAERKNAVAPLPTAVSADRRQMGHKIDCLGTFLALGSYELLFVEVSGAPHQHDTIKLRTDRFKLARCMKDALDDVIRKTHGAAKGVRVFGIQTWGFDCFIYALDLSHDGIYRFVELGSLQIPRAPMDFCALGTAVAVLLNLKAAVLSIISDLNAIRMTASLKSLESGLLLPGVLAAEDSLLLGYMRPTPATPIKPKKEKG